MAEGWLRALGGARFEVASAGTEPAEVHPLAIRAMAEVGVDLSHHRAKALEEVLDAGWDWVITVCDQAAERCPAVPGSARRLHWAFEDPSQARGDDETRLAVFRRVRDQIAARVRDWLRTRPA
jgi:arsenate reductase